MKPFASDPPRCVFFAAGHSVGACLEGLRIERQYFYPEENQVWIDVLEPILAEERSKLTHEHSVAAKSLIRALLAGPAAQERYSFGRAGGDLLACRNDVLAETVVWRAIELARRIDSTEPALPSLWQQVCECVDRDDTWVAISSLAEVLFASRDLAGFEIEEIVGHALPNFVPGAGFHLYRPR